MPRSPTQVATMIILGMGLFWACFGCPSAPKPMLAILNSMKSSKTNNPFVLQTRVKNNGASRFDRLFVYAYHTGAGLNDAMLRSEADRAMPATRFAAGPGSGSALGAQYFAVLYQIGGSPYELMPVTGFTPFPDLQPVRINVNGASPDIDNAFYFSGNTLQWTSSADKKPPGGFAGWVACDSTHTAIGRPQDQGIQLFYRVYPGNTPTGCAEVDLVAN